MWTDGVSTVTPYEHPMLEHAAVSDGLSTFIVVRERVRDLAGLGRPQKFMTVDTPTYRRLVDEIKSWPLDFLLIEQSPEHEFHITASAWGTAPLYLADVGGRLRGSWSLTDLSQQFSLDDLDDRWIMRHLTERARYSTSTMFKSIQMLTERAQATFSAKGLALHYPEAAMHAAPREVREGVDIVEIYSELLSNAVYVRPFNARASAVELSGGMDSASVAISLARQHRGELNSYALAIGGAAGHQQMQRRKEMLAYLGFLDVTVPALAHVPLNPAGERAQGVLVEPGAEPYHEAVGAMLDVARSRGVHTAFTGDGGDELLSLRGDEWAAFGKIRGRFSNNLRLPTWLGNRSVDQLDAVDDDLAPPSLLNESTLLGFALRTPQFLRAGMWPVSPLCDPQLIRFAEQLPASWRNDKRICRERMRRVGFSENVVLPQMRENFVHVMQAGLRAYGMPILQQFSADSASVDLGFVSGDLLRAAVRRWEHGEEVDTKVFSVLTLELALRAIESREQKVEDLLCF